MRQQFSSAVSKCDPARLKDPKPSESLSRPLCNKRRPANLEFAQAYTHSFLAATEGFSPQHRTANNTSRQKTFEGKRVALINKTEGFAGRIKRGLVRSKGSSNKRGEE